MNRKLATLCYLSPQSRGYYLPTTEEINAAFVSNMREFPANDLFLFSEGDFDFPFVKLKKGPQPKGPIASQNRNFIPNKVFITALQIAQNAGCTHFLYLTTDCAVSKPGWDLEAFSEFCLSPKPLVMAGKMVCVNPNGDKKATARWTELVVHRHAKELPPIITVGFEEPPSVYVKLPMAIYEVAELSRLIGNVDLANLGPIDVWIGHKIWESYGPDAYYVVGNLNSLSK